MMKLAILCVLCVLCAASSQADAHDAPVKSRSFDFDPAALATAGTVNPDSVCGLPSQCHPQNCVVNSNGTTVTCEADQLADFSCSLICNDPDAICPFGFGDHRCHVRCDFFSPAEAASCFADCMNKTNTSCQAIFTQ